MTTTTLSDLERMNSANLRDTLTHYLVSAIAKQYPDAQAACSQFLADNYLAPLRPSLDATLVSGPGMGTETLFKEVAREVADALDVRVDFFSVAGHQNPVGLASAKPWVSERFGSDQAKGLVVGFLNDLGDDQANQWRQDHKDALLIRRYYRLDANVAAKLSAQEQPETIAANPNDLHPELRRACQVIGQEYNQNPEHPVYLLNEQNPELAALYIATRATFLPAPPESVAGSAQDPEALRQASLQAGSMAGKMMSRQLFRALPEVSQVLARFGDAEPSVIKDTLLSDLNQQNQRLPGGLVSENLASFMEASARDWQRQKQRAFR